MKNHFSSFLKGIIAANIFFFLEGESATLTLKQIFWKTEIFFKKLEYSFFVERTKIENASFPYKNYHIRSQY